jgi:hypothetical protein
LPLSSLPATILRIGLTMGAPTTPIKAHYGANFKRQAAKSKSLTRYALGTPRAILMMTAVGIGIAAPLIFEFRAYGLFDA